MFVETSTLVLLLPEIALVLLATWLFIGGTFASGRTFWSTFAVVSYLIAGFALFRQSYQFWPMFEAGSAYGPHGPIAVDFLGHQMRWLALLVGLLSTMMVTHTLRKQVACELLGMIMLAVAGVMLVAQATDLVMLFMGLELLSIPTYILLYIGRPGRAGAESTTKYFFLSILSSALLLYGFSFLYGMTGTTTLFGAGEEVPGIRERLISQLASDHPLTALAPLALVLIFAGLGFRIAAVPFHFYAPDVYQGTTNVNAGLLAVLPKVAGGVVLLRFLMVAMPGAFATYAWQFLLVIAILTMTIGNVCALWQTDLRRMMGYSSIAHAGYMLIGLTVAVATHSLTGQEASPGYGGVSAFLFYLIIYAFGTLGAFAILAHLSSEDHEVSAIEEIAGLNKTRPIAAGLMAIFMFSLAGIPPLAGFWGKLTLFTSAVGMATDVESTVLRNWLVVLAVAGALNAAIAGGYYLRIIGAMYFRPSTTTFAEQGGSGGMGAAVICGIVTVVLGLSPSFVLSSASEAERSAYHHATSTQAVGQVAPAAEGVARR